MSIGILAVKADRNFRQGMLTNRSYSLNLSKIMLLGEMNLIAMYRDKACLQFIQEDNL